MIPSLRTFDCNAVLFDMDGTLIDSSACVERHWRRWAARHGLDAASIMAVAHGRRTLETMQEVAPHHGFSEDDAQLLEEEAARDREGVIVVAGAAHLLAALPANTWAVVTSASRYLAECQLEYAGLPVPSVLVSAEDVRQGKPHPEGYLLAAHRLGVPARSCLVVEDTPAGLTAGIAAGMQVLSIGRTYPREKLLGASWIPDFTELFVTASRGEETNLSHMKVAIRQN